MGIIFRMIHLYTVVPKVACFRSCGIHKYWTQWMGFSTYHITNSINLIWWSLCNDFFFSREICVSIRLLSVYPCGRHMRDLTRLYITLKNGSRAIYQITFPSDSLFNSFDRSVTFIIVHLLFMTDHYRFYSERHIHHPSCDPSKK